MCVRGRVSERTVKFPASLSYVTRKGVPYYMYAGLFLAGWGNVLAGVLRGSGAAHILKWLTLQMSAAGTVSTGVCGLCDVRSPNTTPYHTTRAATTAAHTLANRPCKSRWPVGDER